MRRGTRGASVKAAAETSLGRAFAVALAVGLAWPFALLYSAKASALLLTGEWAWAPFDGLPDPVAVLAALPHASPPVALGAAALPGAAVLCFARPALGRHLFGRRLPPGRAWGPEQLPRLAGVGAALVLFLFLGGLS
ncbi:MAG: hypothetical protein AVDCRST_MAG01-01-2325 [uncultured Rubrobacteraceae bacterium]|uniref:Uncharacterized protein n=1 Tax=uncultured Rubrobacteraceae bacterium TaxID=349277 RepID=A0A6J4PR04_9ACTN|nr:MAG: hypothetical protein AVDCRST_MAG01-01-2325 [uncultured Rubrobacteraceae bacterium]